jgi:hypothetical protein
MVGISHRPTPPPQHITHFVKPPFHLRWLHHRALTCFVEHCVASPSLQEIASIQESINNCSLTSVNSHLVPSSPNITHQSHPSILGAALQMSHLLRSAVRPSTPSATSPGWVGPDSASWPSGTPSHPTCGTCEPSEHCVHSTPTATENRSSISLTLGRLSTSGHTLQRVSSAECNGHTHPEKAVTQWSHSAKSIQCSATVTSCCSMSPIV